MPLKYLDKRESIPMQENYRINTPNVMQEVIDGEAVIINFATGSYFSLNGSGTGIWELIEANLSTSAIIGSLNSAYPASEISISTTVTEFLEQLRTDDLLALDSADKNTTPIQFPEKTGAFTKPELNKYTDMQELLLLDPIHDSDETGWANANKSG